MGNKRDRDRNYSRKKKKSKYHRQQKRERRIQENEQQQQQLSGDASEDAPSQESQKPKPKPTPRPDRKLSAKTIVPPTGRQLRSRDPKKPLQVQKPKTKVLQVQEPKTTAVAESRVETSTRPESPEPGCSHWLKLHDEMINRPAYDVSSDSETDDATSMPQSDIKPEPQPVDLPESPVESQEITTVKSEVIAEFDGSTFFRVSNPSNPYQELFDTIANSPKKKENQNPRKRRAVPMVESTTKKFKIVASETEHEKSLLDTTGQELRQALASLLINVENTKAIAKLMTPETKTEHLGTVANLMRGWRVQRDACRKQFQAYNRSLSGVSVLERTRNTRPKPPAFYTVGITVPSLVTKQPSNTETVTLWNEAGTEGAVVSMPGQDPETSEVGRTAVVRRPSANKQEQAEVLAVGQSPMVDDGTYQPTKVGSRLERILEADPEGRKLLEKRNQEISNEEMEMIQSIIKKRFPTSTDNFKMKYGKSISKLFRTPKEPKPKKTAPKTSSVEPIPIAEYSAPKPPTKFGYLTKPEPRELSWESSDTTLAVARMPDLEMERALQIWHQTLPLRSQDYLLSPNDYFKKYPISHHPQAFKLFQLDFQDMYGTEHLVDKAYVGLKASVTNILRMSEEFANPEVKHAAQLIKSVGMKHNSVDVIVARVLPHLLHKAESFIVRPSPSRALSLPIDAISDDFCTLLPNMAAICVETQRRAEFYKEQYLPCFLYLAAIGSSWIDIQKYVIVMDGIEMVVPSFQEALKTAFAIIWCFDIHYSFFSFPIWLVYQIKVYNLSPQDTSKCTRLSTLLEKLQYRAFLTRQPKIPFKECPHELFNKALQPDLTMDLATQIWPDTLQRRMPDYQLQPDAYFRRYMVHRNPGAWRLVYMDFLIKCGQNQEFDFTSKFNAFNKRLLGIMRSDMHAKKREVQTALAQISEVGDNHNCTGHIIARTLPFLIESSIEIKSLRRLTPKKEDIALDFCVLLSSPQEIDQETARREEMYKSEDLTVQPFLVALGESWTTVTKYIVVGKGFKVVGPTFEGALKIAFSMIWCFDSYYSYYSVPIWLIYQIELFQISPQDAKICPGVIPLLQDVLTTTDSDSSS